jgi:two-component system copper resistance phosphate regulon response regulator CusR
MQILVVEDNQRLARNIQKGLQSRNFTVDVAFDGQEAQDMMMNGYDLLIVDVMMPISDGYEFLESVRGKGLKVPIIMLTAKGMIEDKVKGFELGIDDYLTKPFDFMELILRVEPLIRRSTNSTVLINIGDLQLDTNTKKVSRAGVEIDLSATEYRMLEYMMHHEAKVISETEFLEKVWDHSYEGLSNVVRVYMGYLRNKIDKAFPDKNELIKTVRGLGYKIESSENAK